MKNSTAGLFQRTVNRSPAARPPARGFTLLEVLVALAIVAIGLGTTLKFAHSAVANRSRLDARSEAHWVAMNVAAELQLNAAMELPARGVERMGLHSYQWRASPDGALVSVQVAASGSPAETLADITVPGSAIP